MHHHQHLSSSHSFSLDMLLPFLAYRVSLVSVPNSFLLSSPPPFPPNPFHHHQPTASIASSSPFLDWREWMGKAQETTKTRETSNAVNFNLSDDCHECMSSEMKKFDQYIHPLCPKWRWWMKDKNKRDSISAPCLAWSTFRNKILWQNPLPYENVFYWA